MRHKHCIVRGKNTHFIIYIFPLQVNFEQIKYSILANSRKEGIYKPMCRDFRKQTLF